MQHYTVTISLPPPPPSLSSMHRTWTLLYFLNRTTFDANNFFFCVSCANQTECKFFFLSVERERSMSGDTQSCESFFLIPTFSFFSLVCLMHTINTILCISELELKHRFSLYALTYCRKTCLCVCNLQRYNWCTAQYKWTKTKRYVPIQEVNSRSCYMCVESNRFPRINPSQPIFDRCDAANRTLNTMRVFI